MSRDRATRVAHHIQEELGRILTRGLKDPRVGFVTITGVELSPDLRHARVYYSVMGTEEEKRQTAEGLDAAKGFLKREVARALSLRYVPELRFLYDDSAERGARIEKLLREVRMQEAGEDTEGAAEEKDEV
ncbi:MAG TPA: 30S ribosome-binding factor RbfA [Fredinandcohnia sp.]|nr:30S ribosome-binding factor RbfA [Fredinandcohnia sp.]